MNYFVAVAKQNELGSSVYSAASSNHFLNWPNGSRETKCSISKYSFNCLYGLRISRLKLNK